MGVSRRSESLMQVLCEPSPVEYILAWEREWHCYPRERSLSVLLADPCIQTPPPDVKRVYCR